MPLSPLPSPILRPHKVTQIRWAQLAVALIGLLIWLFCSPHRHAEEGAALDRKREFPFFPCFASRFLLSKLHSTITILHLANRQVGSFFAFQFLGCLLTIVFHSVAFCTTSETIHLVNWVAYVLAVHGISQIGTRPGGGGGVLLTVIPRSFLSV